MTADELLFLRCHPGRVAIFEAVEAAIQALGDCQSAVGKSQISWGNTLKFAFLSYPPRDQRGLILTFGLGEKLDHPRIAQAVEPYPHRWTHHVLLTNPEDVDDTIRDFLRQSYDFSMAKKKTGRR